MNEESNNPLLFPCTAEINLDAADEGFWNVSCMKTHNHSGPHQGALVWYD